MKSLLLTILFQALSIYSFSQIVDKRAIDDRLEDIETSIDKSKTRLYIINGIPFQGIDSTRIDSVLRSYDLRYLIDLRLVSCQQVNFPHCNDDIVLILFAFNQNSKTRRRLLKRVRERFTDNYVSYSQHIFSDSKDPVLYIDNKLIHHTETKGKLNSLKLKRVYFISYHDKPVSDIYYGQNAKNGLVRVWTVAD
jgi:hypothetical protein